MTTAKTTIKMGLTQSKVTNYCMSEGVGNVFDTNHCQCLQLSSYLVCQAACLITQVLQIINYAPSL